jgi:Icc-related predicted phosphoesterase
MGRTLAVNPGSVYGDGVLQGAVIELDAKKAKISRYLLVNG